MFLSKVFIPQHKGINNYGVHQQLWSLFPARPEASRDFLFRVEQQQRGIGTYILMQSLLEPISEQGVEVVDSKRFTPEFYREQVLRFTLRANPTKTIKDPSKGTVGKGGKNYTRTVRVPLIDEEAQHAWLARKLENTAHLHVVTSRKEMPIYFRKPGMKRSGKIQPVCFDGVIELTDPEVFKEVYVKGIGRAKAFGCGMLSLARAM